MCVAPPHSPPLLLCSPSAHRPHQPLTSSSSPPPPPTSSSPLVLTPPLVHTSSPRTPLPIGVTLLLLTPPLHAHSTCRSSRTLPPQPHAFPHPQVELACISADGAHIASLERRSEAELRQHICLKFWHLANGSFRLVARVCRPHAALVCGAPRTVPNPSSPPRNKPTQPDPPRAPALDMSTDVDTTTHPDSRADLDWHAHERWHAQSASDPRADRPVARADRVPFLPCPRRSARLSPAAPPRCHRFVRFQI